MSLNDRAGAPQFACHCLPLAIVGYKRWIPNSSTSGPTRVVPRLPPAGLEVGVVPGLPPVCALALLDGAPPFAAELPPVGTLTLLARPPPIALELLPVVVAPPLAMLPPVGACPFAPPWPNALSPPKLPCAPLVVPPDALPARPTDVLGFALFRLEIDGTPPAPLDGLATPDPAPAPGEPAVGTPRSSPTP